MRNRIAKRLLSLALALVMVLGMLPAAAFAAYEDLLPIKMPPLGSHGYGEDNYTLCIVNLNKDLVTINAAMHVGFPGNNITPGYVIHYPEYADRNTWRNVPLSHYPGKSYYSSSGIVTRLESNPFSVKTVKSDGKDTVPVLAMVDNASADRLLNLQEKLFDFKRWANDLMERDYDPASPQRGAMVSPDQFLEGYEHQYENFYSYSPINVLAYRDNVSPLGEGGRAQNMVLVADAVPYEENALQVEVTGTGYVPIQSKETDNLGQPLYSYAGPATMTVKVTNTASYPVLVEVDDGEARFIEIAGDPAPEGNTDGQLTGDWNPGHIYDGFQYNRQEDFFLKPHYLAAGASLVGTISIASQPYASVLPGRAFTEDAVTAVDFTVKNVTNYMGSSGIEDSDKTVTVTHNITWQGSGVNNPEYIPIPYDYDPIYQVTPQVLDYKDIYDYKFVENPYVWSNSEWVHTPTTVTFSGPRLDRVTRILMVAKVYDNANKGSKSQITFTSDNITDRENPDRDKYRQSRGAYSSREVVFTFVRDGSIRNGEYRMVAFKDNGKGAPYTERELEAMTESERAGRFSLRLPGHYQYLPFQQEGDQITLTIPHGLSLGTASETYFGTETENMYRLLTGRAAGTGIPEQIDFYFLTANDTAVVPTTAKLPYWMAGEKNRPDCFKNTRWPALGEDSYSLYNCRLPPDHQDYIERKPNASIFIENSDNKTYTTRFGPAFYLYQNANGAYTVVNEPRDKEVPLMAFTGSNLTVMQGTGSRAVSDRLGRKFDYFIPAGALLNQNMLVRANPYAASDGATSGIYVKRDGDSWEVWSEGCDILVNGKAVMQDFQVLLKSGTKYSADYLGENTRKSYERVPVLPFLWNGKTNTADSIPLIEGGFLNGDVHGGYLYKDSIGLDITIKDPSFLPLDIENLAGVGEVSFRAEVRLPSQPDGGTTWEIRTDGPSQFSLGGKNYVIFTAGANLEFEADTFRETKKEDRFINISGDANLLDLLRMEVICNYKMVGNTYIFDKVYVSGGSDLIGLPPLVPVLQISDVGGGIEGLAGTLAHNDWNYIPPLTLNLDASVALTVKILDISAEKAGVVVGLSKLGVYANSLAIKGNYGTGDDDNFSVNFLRNLEISNSWDLKKPVALELPFPVPVYEMYIQGGVELLDFLSGTASLLVIVDTAELLDAIYKAAQNKGVLEAFNAWHEEYKRTKVFDFTKLAAILGDSTMALLNEIFVSNQVFSVEGNAWGSVSIPSKVPILGGYELASGAAGISYYAPNITLQISGNYDIFIAKGEAGVVFTYNVATGKHDTSLLRGARTMDLSGGGEDYTVTIEGLNFRDVPVVAVQVPVTEDPQPVFFAGEETTGTEEATGTEDTSQPAAAPKLKANALPTPFATVEGYEITSQAGDDVVFVEFLASEPVGITIAAEDHNIEYSIGADLKTPEGKTGWVPVYEDDNAVDEGIEAYRYTFVFYEPNEVDGEGQSIHGKGNGQGGYVWTATKTDPSAQGTLLECNVATIDPPEAISDASFSSGSVTFTAANLKDGETYTASLSLVHKDDVKEGMPTSEGTHVGKLTSVREGENIIPFSSNYETLVQSGEYYAVVHLERLEAAEGDETKTVRLGTVAVSADTLTIINPNAPAAIDGNITHEYAGNGAQRFTFPAPDEKTTGYELTAADGEGAPIMIPYLDNTGKQLPEKTADAFAAPGSYPLKDMQANGKQLTMVPDGSRLVLGETYRLTFTPYHEDSDGKRFYGPGQTIPVEFTEPKLVTATVDVTGTPWKQLTSQEGDPITRYVAQESLVTMGTEHQQVGDPETAGITFRADDVRSMEIVAVGDAFAERDEAGNVTNNKTQILTHKPPVDVVEGDGSIVVTYFLPLSAGEHTFTVTTVSPTGDANTQVFVFTVDGADIQFTVNSHSFDPGENLGGASGQTFTFEALLEDGAKVTQVGNEKVDVASKNGRVSWSGNPAVTPTVLAKEGNEAIAWRYIVPITVEDANGFTTVRALGYEVFDPAADANFPSRLELAVYPGPRLNTAVENAKVSVTAVTAAGTVALGNDEVTFASSNPAVLTVGADGTITVKGKGAATITATYYQEKGEEGSKFRPRGALSVSVVSPEEKPAISLRVGAVTADSVTLELGAVNADQVMLEVTVGDEEKPMMAVIFADLDGPQFGTVTDLEPGTDYTFTANTNDGDHYYAPATVRATTLPELTAGQIYTVTYAQDGADGGSAPVDPNRYAKGDEVKLLASITPLTRSGAEVLGFSTAPNGGGTRYLYADMTEAEPHTFAMGEADVTLYPIWPANSSSGGSGSSGKPQPTFPGGKGWDGVETALKDLPQGGTLAVDMNGATTLPAEVLDAIAGKDVSLELDMGGGAVWVIQGSDVPTGGTRSDLNLGINTKANTIPVTVIDAVTGEQTTLQVELSHSGPFGLNLTLRLAVGEDHGGRWANLYHYNETAGSLDFQASALVGAKGQAALPFSHASSYAVILDDAPHGPWANPFTDVAQADWFYEAARYVHLGGLFSGTGPETFGPNVAMTRAMLWTVLARLDGQDTGGGATWYEKGRTWAMDQGVSDGANPEGMVTREQVAVMLCRYAALRGLDVSGSADLTAFSDGETVSSWAVEALAWANAGGIVTGKPGHLLDPQGEATRAEVAAIFARCGIPPNR